MSEKIDLDGRLIDLEQADSSNCRNSAGLDAKDSVEFLPEERIEAKISLDDICTRMFRDENFTREEFSNVIMSGYKRKDVVNGLKRVIDKAYPVADSPGFDSMTWANALYGTFLNCDDESQFFSERFRFYIGLSVYSKNFGSILGLTEYEVFDKSILVKSGDKFIAENPMDEVLLRYNALVESVLNEIFSKVS